MARPRWWGPESVSPKASFPLGFVTYDSVQWPWQDSAPVTRSPEPVRPGVTPPPSTIHVCSLIQRLRRATSAFFCPDFSEKRHQDSDSKSGAAQQGPFFTQLFSEDVGPDGKVGDAPAARAINNRRAAGGVAAARVARGGPPRDSLVRNSDTC